jgi:DGQHR domain-containing protein
MNDDAAAHNAEEHDLLLPALEIRQGPNRVLYSFAVDGKMLPLFTTVSRIQRHEAQKVKGYQRPEVLRHIAEIRDYLESPDPMIPNAVVVAFDQRVSFQAADVQPFGPGYCRVGTLVIPVRPGTPDEDKPGWIVDGQQRTAAIREARLETFPICVTAFITGDDQEQKEQFILVNSTKPLPKGLIYELLPDTAAKLPTLLQRRRFPTVLLEHLNYDEGSPLLGIIQTPTNPEGLIKDNSILGMLENSLTEGALHRFRDSRTGEGDLESMLVLLKRFWAAVRYVFADAWGLPPRKSRLMHGAGVVSLGFLMDAIADRHRREGIPSEAEFRDGLEQLREVCRWTSGYWDFGPGHERKWNEIQNTSKDIQLLANYLLTQYRRRVWNRDREFIAASG